MSNNLGITAIRVIHLRTKEHMEEKFLHPVGKIFANGLIGRFKGRLTWNSKYNSKENKNVQPA